MGLAWFTVIILGKITTIFGVYYSAVTPNKNIIEFPAKINVPTHSVINVTT